MSAIVAFHDEASSIFFGATGPLRRHKISYLKQSTARIGLRLARTQKLSRRHVRVLALGSDDSLVIIAKGGIPAINKAMRGRKELLPPLVLSPCRACWPIRAASRMAYQPGANFQADMRRRRAALRGAPPEYYDQERTF
jgi:hypothetical protein